MLQTILIQEIPSQTGLIGQIILQRPAALNALDIAMFHAMHEALDHWAVDPKIQAVIVKSNVERVFCAGGDIKQLVLKRHGPQAIEQAQAYFATEYSLNAKIFAFPKPYIAFLNGITLGGGAGISLHGRYRIASEHLRLAMPETAIGFFPDVGSGYFLSRSPGKMGWYLGLTGDSIGAADAYALKLVTHCVSSTCFSLLEAALLADDLSHPETIDRILQSFHENFTDYQLLAQHDIVAQCFGEKDIIATIHALEQRTDDFSQSTAAILQQRSPTSLKVTWEHLARSQRLSFSEVIAMDFKVACHFLQHADVYEGVRALLIDKDKNPKWQPADLTKVDDAMVAGYFM